jgi:hypothetical protein
VEHSHIAAIYDIDEAEGRTFIAMKYVCGGNMSRIGRGIAFLERLAGFARLLVSPGLESYRPVD